MSEMQNLYLFFNLYLVEAYSKKKIKFPALAEGGEPENHEAPAKGSTVIWKALPSGLGGGGEPSSPGRE